MVINIKVELNYPIKDGTEVLFRSPADCSLVTGLRINYIEDDVIHTKDFVFADANGNNLGGVDHLFTENVIVKVILDVTHGMAFVQNADTNAYIENTFVKKKQALTATPNNILDVIKSANDGAIITLSAGNYDLIKLHGKDAYTAKNLTIVGCDGASVAGVSITSGVSSATLRTDTDISNATLPRGLAFRSVEFTNNFSLRNARIDNLTLDTCHFGPGANINILPNYFKDGYGEDHNDGFWCTLRADYFQLYPENIVVKNCTIESSASTSGAIYIIGCGDVTICNNTIKDSAYDGIQIGGYYLSPYNVDVRGRVTITNNAILKSAVRGINLFSMNDSEVSVFGNKLYDCGEIEEVIRVKECANSEFDFGGSDALHPNNTYDGAVISVADKILIEDSVISVSKAVQKELDKKADMDAVNSELDAVRTEMDAVRAEMDATETKLFAVRAEIDSVKTGFDGKMDEAVDSITFSDEIALEYWLHETFVPAMPKNSIRNIGFKCKSISDNLLMGTVHKHNENWVTIDLTEHVSGNHYVKINNMGWRPTVAFPKITAQGTSYGWSYRKWLDGTVECWKNGLVSNKTERLPIKFTETPSVQMTISCKDENCIGHNAIGYGSFVFNDGTGLTSYTAPQVNFYNNSMQKISNPSGESINVRFIGTWK